MKDSIENRCLEAEAALDGLAQIAKHMGLEDVLSMARESLDMHDPQTRQAMTAGLDALSARGVETDRSCLDALLQG